MKISIVIPTYEYKGKAPDMLETCIGSIAIQTYKNYEIVISDHSKSDIVSDYVLQSNLKEKIKYIKNENGRGNSSVNMNNGIVNSDGDIIKIMHMDDWFCNNNALMLMYNYLSKNKDKKWGGFGFNHYYENTGKLDRYIYPHINNNIRTLLGCPSVSFFINNKEDPIYFDENLIIINDSDMHFRLGTKYGYPLLINDICVTIRIHENQVSSQVSEDLHKYELEYYKNKHIKG